MMKNVIQRIYRKTKGILDWILDN